MKPHPPAFDIFYMHDQHKKEIEHQILVEGFRVGYCSVSQLQVSQLQALRSPFEDWLYFLSITSTRETLSAEHGSNFFIT